ncbi:hypothetical protein [Pleionea sediminis]|uniref:hypothetical protein n=1 Tax=Pleionea sediminis TaxID=2569479 RepID=UPI001184B194|nr:hypothetical protein [Pleionea sediminis]
MKKFTLGVLTLGSLILAGCSGDNTAEPDENTAKRTVAVFNPSGGSIPVPNDLLFQGTQDLTLNIPVADASDFSDPQNAINALDGWSTSAPISLPFLNTDSSITVDASTLVAGSTVRMFEVLADTSYELGSPNLPTFAPLQVVRELTAQEFVVVLSGNTAGVVPLRPLEQRTTYMIIMTDGIMDTQGLPVLSDYPYDLVSSEDPIVIPDDYEGDATYEGLAALQGLVNQIENVAAAGGVEKDSIISSFTFTTQSVGTVLGAAKSFYVDLGISLFDPTGGTPGLPTTPQYPTSTFSSLFTDTAPFTGNGNADLYKGEVELSYLLETQTAENPTGPITGFWKGAAMVPNNGNPLDMVPNPLAGGFVTYLNALPEKNSDETIPLLVSLPNGCAKPAEGFPVVIFQHGITRNRTDMLGVANGLAAQCRAVIAMDLPLHGIDENDPVHLGLQQASGGLIGIFEGYTAGDVRERTFGIDFLNNTTGAAGPDGTPDSSGAHFINLRSLLTSRDNLRQGVLDLLTLKSAIPAMDVDGDGMPDFNASEVDFIGHSLGAIIGSSFVAYSDETTHFSVDSIVTSPLIDTATLGMPGGGIAGLLNASDTFGPQVRAGVAAGAGVTTDDPSFPGILQQFLFASQTVIDSGDPINTASYGVMNAIPTFLVRVEGDTVIPNNSAAAPLSGTDPLAAYLGLTTVAVDNAGDTMVGNRLVSRFNLGTHGSIISPGDTPQVTQEIQTQFGTFIATDGAGLVVSDPTLLD